MGCSSSTANQRNQPQNASRTAARAKLKASGSSMSNITPTPNAVAKKTTLFTAKWARLVRITYFDEKLKKRTWDAVERSTRPKGGVDGVFIIAKLTKEDEAVPHLIVISQFRPPVGWTLEFPAGLVEEGETCEAAGIRELLEETGYTGKFVNQTATACLDPGLSNANIVHVQVDVDGSLECNKNPNFTLNDGEGSIKVHLVAMDNLEENLAKLAAEKSLMVNSSLLAFSNGIAAAKALA